MKKIMLSLLAIALCASLQAQTGEIKGKVLDSLTNEALPTANIFIKYGETVIGTSSDSNGKFTLKGIKAGTYNLTVSSVGFNTKKISGVKVTADKISFPGIIYLSEAIIEGGEVVIEAVRYKLIDPESPGKETMRFTEMKKNTGRTSVGNMIEQISPKVTQVNGQLYFGGNRAGTALYYVDGIKSFKPIKVPMNGLSSITVYTGGVPAKYGDCTGGIVVMETKSYFDLYNEWKATQ